jgi:predicted nucleic acid-binding protein
MAYWDTACLVKLYVSEHNSAVFNTHLLSGASVITSGIARLEFWATVRRKEAAGDVHAGGARAALAALDSDIAAGQIRILAMDSSIVSKFEAVVERCHGQTPAILLRTLDAVHLATAVISGENQLVATDRRLRDAAILVGLNLYPP